jgi:hypothetical protein
MEQNTSNPYLENVIKTLNTYDEDLWNNLDRISQLPTGASRAVLAYFIELACQCQNEANITLGRQGIWSLPRAWVTENIQRVATEMLSLDDEWEYRRLLEVYEKLDSSLLKSLVDLGLGSRDEDIAEAAVEFAICE